MRLLGSRRVKGELWIPEWAVDRMVEEAEESKPNETGGALMGYATEDGLVITRLIGAGPNALHSASRFVPDKEYQLAEIARLYVQSGRIHTFVGDWHSHPEGSAEYSREDRSALRAVARSPEGRCEEPLMVILGGGDPWTMIGWRYVPGRWWDTVSAMTIRRF